MEYRQAIQLLNEVQDKLEQTSDWQYFWNNISVSDLQEGCSYIYERLDALGAYDLELNEFLNVFLRAEKARFDRFLRKEKYFLITVGMTVNYRHYRAYARKLLNKIKAIRNKIEEIRVERNKILHSRTNEVQVKEMANDCG